MDDIRKKQYARKLDRKVKINKIFIFLRKNWLRITIVLFLLSLIIFPTFMGSVVGEWFNKLVTAFIENIKF